MENHKKIYKTRYWRDVIRPAVIDRDKGICFFCGKLIKKRATIHHIEELNEENYNDYDIAFGLDNLVACHSYCHDYHHKRFGYKESIVCDDLSINYARRTELMEVKYGNNNKNVARSNTN